MEKLLILLKKYSKGKTIYPGVLIRELNIDMTLAYKVLNEVMKLGFLTTNFEIYCHKCSKFTGGIYETIAEIPEEIECDEMGHILNPLNSSIVIFRVIRDD
ncbi:response regulator [Paenibacillus monticola]|uniref:response regulator n=1 Tax=Paenibacillus monticola TaxID=2666075 RepID=UPI001E4899D1|nr:response regulator [Paenibacillus monticola]